MSHRSSATPGLLRYARHDRQIVLLARISVAGSLLILACGEPGTQPVSFAFHIDPTFFVSLVPGESAQLSALNNATGQPVQVSWRLEDPTFGVVSPTGYVTGSKCPGPAVSDLKAVLLADTTFTATTRVFRTALPLPRLNLLAMVYVPFGAPVILDSVAGQIDVRVRMNPSGCAEVTVLRVLLKQGNTTTIVSSLGIRTSTTPASVDLILRWDADLVANGAYQINLVAEGPQGQVVEASPAIALTVRHQ